MFGPKKGPTEVPTEALEHLGRVKGGDRDAERDARDAGATKEMIEAAKAQSETGRPPRDPAWSVHEGGKDKAAQEDPRSIPGLF